MHMSIEKRRMQEVHQMKEKIESAAIEIINTEGYEKLSIRKIAKKIDYSPTNIYNYYLNKMDIVEHIIIRHTEEVIVKAAQAVEANQHLSIEAQFKVFVKTFIRVMLDKPEQVQAILLSGVNIFKDYPIDEDTARIQNQSVALLYKGYEAGIFIEIDQDVATLLITNILGFVSMIIRNKVEDKEKINTLIELESNWLLKGILR